jgi:hypothetical protein
MLSGSLALITYAIPRMTRDIDIVIELRMEDLNKFAAIFREGHYIHLPAVEEAIKKRGMFNVIDFESGTKIDFIVRKNTEYRKTEFKRKIRSTSFGFEAWVVAIEDLIISKLIWIQDCQSERQMLDIQELLKNTQVDNDYLQFWYNKLDLQTFGLL